MDIFEKLFYALFPLFVGLVFCHFTLFLGAWLIFGREDEKFRGKKGFIKYYFYTLREAFTTIKETYSYEESEKNE